MKSGLDNFRSMSVRKLKAFLTSHKVDISDCLEKTDLVNKVEYHGLHWHVDGKDPAPAAPQAKAQGGGSGRSGTGRSGGSETASRDDTTPNDGDGDDSKDEGVGAGYVSQQNDCKAYTDVSLGEDNVPFDKEAEARVAAEAKLQQREQEAVKRERERNIKILIDGGINWKNKGKLAEAIDCYEKALKMDTNHPRARRQLAICLSDLGSALRCEGRTEEGFHSYHRSLAADCEYAAAWYNLGVCYAEKRQMDQAQVHYQMCLKFDPLYAEAHNNLGAHFKDRGNTTKAIEHYQAAVAARPAFVLPYSNLAACFHCMGNVNDAQKAGETAIAIDANYSEAHNNLGSIYLDQGLVERAVASFQRCLDLAPDNERFKADSNKMLALNFLRPLTKGGKKPCTDAEDDAAVTRLLQVIWKEHKKFGDKYMRRYRQFTKWGNNKRKDRKIRVGFLSSDFKTHSVSFFIESPLRFMDPNAISVYCYFSGPGDGKTQTVFKQICPAGRWRDLEGVSVDGICQMIRDDTIDILVELGGHSAGSRLDVMARKPAPVSMTWIGYANTTGLPCVDYRLTDAIADPLNTKQKFSEKLIRMPSPCAFLCYKPNADVPPVAPLPGLKNGYITFGSFNALGKINDDVMMLWCRVLRAIPNSRFIMKCKHFASNEIKQRFIRKFERLGVSLDRVTLMSQTPTIAEHMALYSKIDLALDSFPYAGTTTTTEALYMGVPVVTLQRKASPIHAQNVGASLLHRIKGLSAYAADSEDQYVQICADAFTNLKRLSIVRSTLRMSMDKSPLCDGPNFCRVLEGVFKDMWGCYCDGTKMKY